MNLFTRGPEATYTHNHERDAAAATTVLRRPLIWAPGMTLNCVPRVWMCRFRGAQTFTGARTGWGLAARSYRKQFSVIICRLFVCIVSCD